MKFYYILSTFLLTAISCKNKATKNITSEEPIIDLAINYSLISAENKNHWKNIVTTFYENTMKPKLNGQFLVAKNGEILFETYNGNEFLHRDSSKPMNKHSAIHLASVSKPFTAASILLLSQKGKLNIDDVVTKYLPTFPYADVTVRMLMNHRAGLPDYTHLLIEEWGWPKGVRATNKDVLQYMASSKALQVLKTNTRFDYCNTNYVMLALIVEAVSGLQFGDYLKKYIFKPLQMNDSYLFAAKDTATAILSYDRRGHAFSYDEFDLTYGDKNIYSTVRDLYKWDQAWYTNKLIDEKHKEMAFAPYSNEKPGIKNYGLGWRMFEFEDDKKIIFHNGWWHGNNNAFIRLYQDSATFICLGNVKTQSNYAPMQLSYIFGQYPFEYKNDDPKDTAEQAQAQLMNALKAKADSLKLIQKPQPKPIKDTSKKRIDSLRMIENKKKTIADSLKKEKSRS